MKKHLACLALLSAMAAPTAARAAAGPVKYEDFETGDLVWPYTYDDGSGAQVSQALAPFGHSGKRSVLFSVNTTGGSWGAGGGFGSSYPGNDKGGVVATGATRVGFWIKTDKALNLAVALKEGNAPGKSPQNEEWKTTAKPIPASTAWQQVEFPLNAYKVKAATGNGLMDLASISNVDFLFGPGAAKASVYVDDIYFVARAGETGASAVAAAPSGGMAATVPVSWPLKYQDAEGVELPWLYTYQDDASKVKVSQVPGGHSGAKAICYDLDTAGGSWGAGGGFGTSYPTSDGGGVNATGATQITFWAKADKPMMVAVSLKEGNAPGKSPMNEEWNSPLKKIPAGAWQKIAIPLAALKFNAKKGTTGNRQLDLGNITNVDFMSAQGVPASKLLIDDIYFEK